MLRKMGPGLVAILALVHLAASVSEHVPSAAAKRRVEGGTAGTPARRIHFGGSPLEPVIEGCAVYFAQGPRVVRASVCGGAPGFARRFLSAELYGQVVSVSVADDVIYAGTSESRLYALRDSADGFEIIGELEVGAVPFETAVLGQTIFVAGSSDLVEVIHGSADEALVTRFTYRPASAGEGEFVTLAANATTLFIVTSGGGRETSTVDAVQLAPEVDSPDDLTVLSTAEVMGTVVRLVATEEDLYALLGGGTGVAQIDTTDLNRIAVVGTRDFSAAGRGGVQDLAASGPAVAVIGTRDQGSPKNRIDLYDPERFLDGEPTASISKGNWMGQAIAVTDTHIVAMGLPSAVLLEVSAGTLREVSEAIVPASLADAVAADGHGNLAVVNSLAGLFAVPNLGAGLGTGELVTPGNLIDVVGLTDGFAALSPEWVEIVIRDGQRWPTRRVSATELGLGDSPSAPLRLVASDGNAIAVMGIQPIDGAVIGTVSIGEVRSGSGLRLTSVVTYDLSSSSDEPIAATWAGDTVLVVHRLTGVHSIAVPDLDHARYSGPVVGLEAVHIATAGSLIVGSSARTVRIYERSDVGLIRVGSITLSGPITDLTGHGDKVYAAVDAGDQRGELVVIDVSAPASPAIAEHATVWPLVTDIAATGRGWYVGAGSGGVFGYEYARDKSVYLPQAGGRRP